MGTYNVYLRQEIVAISTYVAEVEAETPYEAFVEATKMAKDGEFEENWNYVGLSDPKVKIYDVEEA